MMTKAHRQEALSRAYVQAVAAHTGMTVSGRQHDYGMDMTLHEINVRRGRHFENGNRLDLQLRTTTRALVSDDQVLYDLDIRTYNQLLEAEVNHWPLLVLLVLPQAETTWVRYLDEGLLLSGEAHWMSLLGATPSNARRTVRIAIPRRQVFTRTALQNLLQRIRRGESL